MLGARGRHRAMVRASKPSSSRLLPCATTITARQCVFRFCPHASYKVWRCRCWFWGLPSCSTGGMPVCSRGGCAQCWRWGGGAWLGGCGVGCARQHLASCTGNGGSGTGCPQALVSSWFCKHPAWCWMCTWRWACFGSCPSSGVTVFYGCNAKETSRTGAMYVVRYIRPFLCPNKGLTTSL